MEILNQIREWTQYNNVAWYISLIAVFICCSGDVISGVFNAYMKGELKSYKFKQGALGKTAIVAIVGLSMGLDYYFKTNYLYTSTCIFYIIEETLSIIENLGDYIKIPTFLKNRISQLKGENNNE